MPDQKSFIENRRLGFYTDKYGIHVHDFESFLYHKVIKLNVSHETYNDNIILM